MKSKNKKDALSKMECIRTAITEAIDALITPIMWDPIEPDPITKIKFRMHLFSEAIKKIKCRNEDCEERSKRCD